MSMNLDVNFRKTSGEHHNIRGEEFQRVGRTIFIKSKMLLFPYTLIISTQMFKILTFFYQVIILLKQKLKPQKSTMRKFELDAF